METRFPPPLLPTDDAQGLAERVYGQLKAAIIRGDLPPGERLVELRLTKRYNVSRTPLREALNRLALEDLVVLRPNAGYRVTPLTIGSFRELCEVRRILEPQCASLAARQATPEQRAAINDSAALRFDRGQPDSYTLYCESNFAFHCLIAVASGNSILAGAVERALNRHQQPSFLGLGRKRDADEANEEHLAIAAAIAEGDARQAKKLMHNHVRQGESRIITALKKGGYAD